MRAIKESLELGSWNGPFAGEGVAEPLDADACAGVEVAAGAGVG
ncbi:MAG TPA: hypothetical protein VF209_04575 [Patescibacteria group bacterium]